MPASADQRSPSRTSAGTRLRAVDGLRALAATMVVFDHAIWIFDIPIWTTNSFVAFAFRSLEHGVTLFFVISGFLLFRPYTEAAVNAAGRPRVWAFWRNRFLRIFPGYWSVLIVACLVFDLAVVRVSPGVADISAFEFGRLTDPGLLVSNLLLVQGYFPNGVLTGLGVSWSLVPELAFYLVVPLLGVAARRISDMIGRPAVLVVPAGMIVFGWASQLVIPLITGGVPGRSALVLTTGICANADLFGYGMLLAAAVSLSQNGSWSGLLRWCFVGAAVGSLGWICTFGYEPSTLLGVASAGLLGLTIAPQAAGLRGLLVKFFDSAPLRKVGEVSYGIYLWHYPIAVLAYRHGWYVSGWPGLILNGVALLAIAFSLAALTYRFVEKPALRFKVPVVPRRTAPADEPVSSRVS